MRGRSFPHPTQPWTPKLHIQEGFQGGKSPPKSLCQLARDQDKERERLCNLLPIHFTAFWEASGRTGQLCVGRIKMFPNLQYSFIHSSNVQRQGVLNSIVNLALERQR